MTNHFEKPKDWNVAPQSSWVSGTPIGQSEIKMPNLGDPGSHENSSQKISFGDNGPEAQLNWRVAPGGKRIPPGKPCPEGTETKGATCAQRMGSALVAQNSNTQNRERDEEVSDEETKSQLEGLRRVGVESRLEKGMNNG